MALAPAELATPIRIVAAKNSWTLAELAAVNYEIAKLDRKRLLKISYDSQFNTSWYRYTLFARRACGIEKLK